MPTLRNTNPLGDVDIVGVGPVKAGETFEVDDATAKSLLKQDGNYESAEHTAKKKG